MSSRSSPISASRFAEAVQDLPVGNIHLKAAEIQNSLRHLLDSNRQMRSLAEEGDDDCITAIEENLVVIARMRARKQILRNEIENRGLPWPPDLDETEHQGVADGYGNQSNMGMSDESAVGALDASDNVEFSTAPQLSLPRAGHGDAGPTQDDEQSDALGLHL